MTGYKRHLNVNYVHFNTFLRTVSYSFMKSATYVFAVKKFSKDFFDSEFCYKFDQSVIGPCVVQPESNRARNFKSALHARPILKLLARLLPKLYSTWSIAITNNSENI